MGIAVMFWKFGAVPIKTGSFPDKNLKCPVGHLKAVCLVSHKNAFKYLTIYLTYLTWCPMFERVKFSHCDTKKNMILTVFNCHIHSDLWQYSKIHQNTSQEEKEVS